MSRKIIFSFNLFLILIIISGCATVFGGYKNKLVIKDGSPPAAEVYLDGQKIGTTPVDQKVSKYLLQEGSLIEIKKQGYKTDSIVVKRKINPYYTLVDVLAGGVWLGIDIATGNLYRPATGRIKYELKEE